MHSDAFDVIPYEDIKGNWKKLGSGSFGNVYRGVYLGLDVAIKEVLPSNNYDVAKYFEREWRLMKEARHPNVVLYLGLSRAPDGRIFIISEYIDNGNLRMYIHDKSKPFPWRLRLSFATDIARALAYLHARKCIHRDLKGENLLVTSNGRLKITDFGFARIAARNEEESKRLTFCGTDSYMSPEILTGTEFDLPTDIFSLGIIFCEIASRKLADDNTFRRSPPSFAIDPDEVRKLAGPGCPPAFISLALECVKPEPSARPNTRVILDRLREIEAEVLSRPSEAEDMHLGTVKFMTGGRRPGAAPRIPSFGMGVGKDIGNGNGSANSSIVDAHSSDEDSDEELMQAVAKLSNVNLDNAWTEDTKARRGDSAHPLIDNTSSMYSQYSTTVIRSHSPQYSESAPPSLSSILTIRPSPNPNGSDDLIEHPPATGAHGPTPTESLLSIESYYTASTTSETAPSIAAATEGGSTVREPALPLVHRFTLLKPGAKRMSIGGSRNASPTRHLPGDGLWNPLDFFFSSTLLAAKCDVCAKRLGWKPVLECDDCGLRAHVKCGENAPMDCGIRQMTAPVPLTATSAPPSPLGKAKQNK
ncbi:kinase-like protein [Sparassis latifolia]|uniref:Putative serine/threonine-protein kinase kinX n=1 Tax=Sparassis crispa TaxID=139825 RepID=A0A401GY42_9APHY|nr:putative serine/threonine-protein kinase kinX [Sparassis crispa]GBE87112.1 putative serine/threonine-protein kinase kinX [Sparassis crispa]